MAAGGAGRRALQALLASPARLGGGCGAAPGVTIPAENLQCYPGSRRYSNYGSSPFIERIKTQYEYETIKNPPEWKYVQRLLPFETIPAVKPKDDYPSGWYPPKEEALNLPFFLQRTKNHQVPIYLKLKLRGARKITLIRKIEGDIWMMNDEIKALLKNKHGRYIETRVHEFTRSIEVKGDYVIDLQNWAFSKGL